MSQWGNKTVITIAVIALCVVSILYFITTSEAKSASLPKAVLQSHPMWKPNETPQEFQQRTGLNYTTGEPEIWGGK